MFCKRIQQPQKHQKPRTDPNPYKRRREREGGRSVQRRRVVWLSVWVGSTAIVKLLALVLAGNRRIVEERRNKEE